MSELLELNRFGDREPSHEETEEDESIDETQEEEVR
jgi:hypothetical protein